MRDGAGDSVAQRQPRAPDRRRPARPRRTTREAQQVWVGYWTQCDPELGRMMGARVQQAQQAHGVAPTAAM